MPTTRLTLVNNANRSQSTVLLLDLSGSSASTFSLLLRNAHNKLRLKRASQIFTARGNLLPSGFNFSQLENGDRLYVSCGEPFVGTVQEEGSERARPASVRVIATKAPVENEAVEQLKRTAKLEGMLRAVGMPDLHPGNSSPIGAAFISKDRVFPQLIGGDIGCGMALYTTSVSASTTPESLDKKLRGLEGPYDGSTKDWLVEHEIILTATDHDSSLGTIGGGNHFAELQQVTEVKDQATFTRLGLKTNRLALLVHSGSRGLGQHILRSTSSTSLVDPSPELSTYLLEHDNACTWALANRELIAHRFLSALNASANKILDIWHNNVEKTTMRFLAEEASEEQLKVWIHRKGAAPSDRGPIVIPGSRGTCSYLVMPEGDQEDNARSVAHGAGRVWDRKKARERGEKRFGSAGKQTLRTTKFGGKVICEDDELLFEEVPEAYKDIDAVVKDLVDLGIIRIVAIFEPVVTYKTRLEDRE